MVVFLGKPLHENTRAVGGKPTPHTPDHNPIHPRTEPLTMPSQDFTQP
jgi:hypothetical protein